MSSNQKKRITVAITGASGSIYAFRLLKKLRNMQDQIHCLSVVFSDNAKLIWQEEIGKPLPVEQDLTIYENNDFYAPIASGSSRTDVMVIVPVSMGLLGRVAHGISDDLITRAADVMLKERRTLILVPRETPFSLIHIRNMESITLAGGIICPSSPSFYQKPQTINDIVDSVVDRIIDLMGLEQNTYRWGEPST